MIWQRRRSLFQQILLASLGPMLVLFIALFSYSLAARLNDAKLNQLDIGHRIAENVAALVELPLISGSRQQLDDILQSALHGDITAIRIYSDHLEHPVSIAKDGAKPAGHTISTTITQRSIPLQDSITGERFGSASNNVLGRLELDISSQRLHQLQQRIVRVSSSIASLAVIIGIGVAWLISRRLSQPLSEIQTVTQRIAQGDHSSRISHLEQGELGELQRHINYMADSIDVQQRVLNQHVEELKQAKSRAEAANVAKSQFLATMTHELRTPMNGALGMLQLLAKSPLSDEQLNYVNIAKSSSEHLLHIVNDILDFSRIEKGDMQLEERFFPARSLLAEFLQPLRFEAQSKGIQLLTDVDPQLEDIEILGDETRLRQLILNLCANAVKFTHDGEVRIRLSQRQRQGDKLQLELQVSDTGIGISDEQKPHIFDSFHQADSSTVRRYGGSGLGLAIVKRLSEVMSAELSLDSELGRGSCFTLRWHSRCRKPLAETTTSQIEYRDEHCFLGVSALVVEDNPVNQLLVARSLQGWGAKVMTADNGVDAVRLLEKHPFNVVLMDLQMPLMDGYEATLQLRRRLHLDTPVIALTANTDSHTQRQCLNAGMNAFLSKPISLQKLQQSIAELLPSAIDKP